MDNRDCERECEVFSFLRHNQGEYCLALLYSEEDGYLTMTMSDSAGSRVAWPMKGPIVCEDEVRKALEHMKGVLCS